MQIKRKEKTALLEVVNKLNDVRFIGQVIFVVVVLLLSWSGVKVIQTNYNLQKQIAILNQQNNLQKLKNNNLALQNQYYNSDQYLELSARQNFGLAAQGEKELIVPQQVALDYTIDVKSISTTSTVQISKQPKYQKNIESWVNFFLHRPNTN
ncbi:MAG: septum formation initiator family protein [Candidatus Saccharimonadales bacterium]